MILLPDETHSLRTRDGIELTLRRIRSRDVTRGAVILQHGLAANGMVFDLPGRSLARFLAEAGRAAAATDWMLTSTTICRRSSSTCNA